MFSRLKKIYEKITALSNSVEAYQQETGKQAIPSVAYINRAKKFIDKGKFNEALNILNEALEISPNDALIYKYMGIAFENGGDLEKAVDLYEKSAELNPQDKNIWHKLGMVFVTLRKYPEAESAFQKADSVTPVNTDINTGWGISLYKQQKYNEAHEKFIKAIGINRYNFSAMLLASIVEMKLKKFDDAEAKLKFLIGVNPNESVAYEYAHLFYLRKQYEEALNYAQKSIEYNKNMLPAYILSGEIYSRFFDYENSIKYYKEALKNELVNAVLYKEWGSSLVRLNRFEEAKEMYQKALLTDMEMAEAQTGFALCSAETGDYEKVDFLIGEIGEKAEQDEKLKEVKGLRALDFGEPQKAVEIFKELLLSDDINPYNYFRLAKCYQKLNNDDMVKDSFEKLIKFSPKFENGYLEFAKYLQSKGEYKEAQRKLRKAVYLFPQNQEILNLLFYVSYILVKEDLCEYNVKEAISLANGIAEFRYPELKAELEILLKNIKENK